MSLQRRFKRKVNALTTVSPKSFQGIHNEQHYSVAELAKLWGLSEDFIRPIFRNEDGVLKVVRPENVQTKKREYVSLRIPASIAAKVHQRLHGSVAA